MPAHQERLSHSRTVGPPFGYQNCGERMKNQPDSDSAIIPGLDQISTQWSIVRDSRQFLMRYARAIRRYFLVLITNRHDAEEVAQEFFLRVVKVGFPHVREGRGRFRDYLKELIELGLMKYVRNHLRANRRGT